MTPLKSDVFEKVLYLKSDAFENVKFLKSNMFFFHFRKLRYCEEVLFEMRWICLGSAGTRLRGVCTGSACMWLCFAFLKMRVCSCDTTFMDGRRWRVMFSDTNRCLNRSNDF